MEEGGAVHLVAGLGTVDLYRLGRTRRRRRRRCGRRVRRRRRRRRGCCRGGGRRGGCRGGRCRRRRDRHPVAGGAAVALPVADPHGAEDAVQVEGRLVRAPQLAELAVKKLRMAWRLPRAGLDAGAAAVVHLWVTLRL